LLRLKFLRFFKSEYERINYKKTFNNWEKLFPVTSDDDCFSAERKLLFILRLEILKSSVDEVEDISMEHADFVDYNEANIA